MVSLARILQLSSHGQHPALTLKGSCCIYDFSSLRRARKAGEPWLKHSWMKCIIERGQKSNSFWVWIHKEMRFMQSCLSGQGCLCGRFPSRNLTPEFDPADLLPMTFDRGLRSLEVNSVCPCWVETGTSEVERLINIHYQASDYEERVEVFENCTSLFCSP